MLIIKKTARMFEEIAGFVCDCCGKVVDDSSPKTSQNSWIEMQEFVHIPISGGYGSVFGDGAEIETVLCQHCVKQLLGPYFKGKPGAYEEEEEQPYITEDKVKMETEYKYNPDYGDDRICVCGHTYDRHFDSYENMEAVGCKYCDCYGFREEIK